jgi:predicted Zn-dependent peptidase
MDFYKTFYVPNNATLSIAGDLSIPETKKLIKMYFGDIPKGTKEIPRPEITEPQKTAEVRDTVYDNIQLPAVIMGYHMPAQGEDDYYAMSMLAQYLSQGESSRFNKVIKGEKEKALFVGAFPIPTEDPGMALMFGITNMGVAPDDLENAMNTEIDLVKKEIITEKEFEKLRNQMESDFISGNGTVRGLAENLANYHVYFGDANLINTEINRYMKVSREDIKAVANKYLNDENRVVLYYLPKSQQAN